MGSSQEDILNQLSYQSHGEVPTILLSFTNEMNHIISGSAEKKLWLVIMTLLVAVVRFNLSRKMMSG